MKIFSDVVSNNDKEMIPDRFDTKTRDYDQDEFYLYMNEVRTISGGNLIF